MGLISRQLLKVIEYQDSRHDTICYKFPMTNRVEIMNGSTLIVREGQVAIFVKDGKIADVFAPGRYKLETKNLPVLTSIMSWKTGFNSPFKADVYFVSTTQFSGNKWGTANPFTMRDPDFGAIRVRCHGTYSFKVIDAKSIMQQMIGSKLEFTTANLQDHLRSLITSNISDIIAGSKFSALDLASQLTEFSEIAKVSLQDRFNSIGLLLVTMVMENISFPAEVEKAIDERTSVGIMSDKMGSYTTMQQLKALNTAAGNAGTVGTIMGMNMMGGMTQGGVLSTNAQRDANSGGCIGGGKFCSQCGASVKATAKFCGECGAKQNADAKCAKCGHAVKPSTKFCPECGSKI